MFYSHLIDKNIFINMALAFTLAYVNISNKWPLRYDSCCAHNMKKACGKR